MQNNRQVRQPRDNHQDMQPFERNIANLMQNQMKMFDNMTKNFFGGAGGRGMGSVFGDFEGDNFGRFGSMFDGIEKDINRMMIGAGDSGQQGLQTANGRTNGGHFVSQTYAFSKSMGKDGKPVTKKYFSNKVNGVDQQGKRLGEMQELYHDTGKGKKVIAQERTLNNNGRRVVKRKIRNGKHRHLSVRP